jgi:hypothetical protein
MPLLEVRDALRARLHLLMKEERTTAEEVNTISAEPECVALPSYTRHICIL